MIIRYPVKDNTISQPFGRDASNDPIYKEFYAAFDYKHCGVDFPLAVGTEVFASFAGIVVRSENHIGMGNVVGIRNGNIIALYAHLSKISVQLGEIVNEGILIGYSGDTGEACPTPHLHFELRDITKPTLKEMVFEPHFAEEVSQYVSTFKYIVNNKYTKKTLKSLAKLYFGNESMWKLLKDANGYSFDGDDVLEDSLTVIIPNF
jgi:murein DD-endopeptidase MepM/ murein hydrolase activator NlpD